MKDNNLNNTKNDEYNDLFYKPEGQITKSVYELLKNSKDGNFNDLKQLIDEKEFQGSTLNLALRNLIKGFKEQKKTAYIECFKLLLSTNIDLNYKYAKKNNKTILMMIFRKIDIELMKILIENFKIKLKSSNNNYSSNEEKDEYEFLENKNFFTQKDLKNNNFMHINNNTYFDKKELFKIIEYLYDEYPKNYHNLEVSKKIQEMFKNLFIEKNSDGNTFINFCLKYEIPKLLLKLISINGYINNINKEKNNYLHCAVLGKNFSCLKIILYYCTNEELNMKNSEMLTPSQLAYKNGYITMSNIIIEYQKNFNEEEYKEHFYSNMEIYENKILNLSKDLIINFTNYKYKELLYELNELKIINHLSSDDLNSNNDIEQDNDILFTISYLKLEWNILLTQIKINQTDYEKENDNNTNFNNNKFGKNNKKKLKKIEDKNKIIISSYYKSIFDFFENNFSNKFIYLYFDFLNQINNKNNDNIINIEKPIEILIYNKIIFYFKFGYTKSLIDTIEILFTKFIDINDIFSEKEKEEKEEKEEEKEKKKNKKIKFFILFINISCILAETFISLGYHNFAEIIINSIDKYSYIRSPKDDNDIIDYNKLEISIFNYLTNIGVFNEFLPYYIEIFCYSNFLRLLISKDKNKEYFAKINKLLNNYKEIIKKENIIFKRLNILNLCIEIKKLYEKEDNQIYKKIPELKKYNDSEIFYFNTIGIIYLKKQKYNLSLYFFKKALGKYIQILKNKNLQNNQKEKIVNYRIDYISSLLYNISLCHFYLKNYSKCISILEQLLLFKCNQINYFFYYRLGLCFLYIYIDSNKKNYDYYNENILKVIGYEKEKNNNKKNKSEEPLSIDLDNEESSENSSNKVDSLYKKNINEIINSNEYSGSNNKDYSKKNNIYYDINNTKYNLKKIILKNTTNIFNNHNLLNKNGININNNIKNNKINNNIFNNINNIKSTYLDKAIKSFRKVILISKKTLNLYTESMKTLYNFYSSFFNDDKKFKIDDESKKFYKKKKIPNDLLINTYLNLLLCLSIKKNWLEMILIIKEYNNRKIVSNKVILLKILLYKLEAYVNLKNTQKIKETINKLKGYKKIELSLFNKANYDIINVINIKFYLYYTLTLISIKEKNFKEIEINMNKILFLIKEEKNIPYYIIDLLINVFLIKLNNETNLNEKTKFRYNNIILNLIKNKKTNLEE